MEHRIEKLDGFKVTGLDVDCTHEDISAIGPLWDKFMARYKEIEGCLGVYGVCFDQPGGFKYVCGSKIASADYAPDGMRIWEVPGAKYAVYDFHGKPEEMAKAFAGIFNTHMKEAGLRYREDAAVLERYPDDCWDEKKGTLKADLMVPLAD